MAFSVDPSRLLLAGATGNDGSLTQAQVDQWRTAGFTLTQGVLPASLIRALSEAAIDQFPTAGSAAASEYADFGSAGGFIYPSTVAPFNDITLHQNLLNAVARLLNCRSEDIRLTQSDLWPKYGHSQQPGAQSNADQRIHVDYPNHTLVHPAPWDRPEAVEMIIYLSDFEVTGGATAVVPRKGEQDPAYRWPIVDSPGIGDLRYINDRSAAEVYFAEQRPELTQWRQSLYQREHYTAFKPGDILFYRHDTWHRGTPMQPGTLRLVQNITYRRAEAEWISTLHTGWSWQAYRDSKYLERLIAGASLQQRAVLGFPQPDSDYWNEQTLAAVAARYGMFGFDITPYQQAVAQGAKPVA